MFRLDRKTHWVHAVPLLPVLACAVLLYLPRREHLLLYGEFHRVSHLGRGGVSIVERPDGSRLLRLVRLDTDDAPSLQVILVAAPDAWDNDAVRKAGFVTLGSLDSGSTSASYGFPREIDLTRYRAVTIWSTRYQVNFLTASLHP